jgi:hypothetical protein
VGRNPERRSSLSRRRRPGRHIRRNSQGVGRRHVDCEEVGGSVQADASYASSDQWHPDRRPSAHEPSSKGGSRGGLHCGGAGTSV